jgi:hypothetical protein
MTGLNSNTVSATGVGEDPWLTLGTGLSELRYKPWGLGYFKQAYLGQVAG